MSLLQHAFFRTALFVALASFLAPSAASAFEVRVSVKFILDTNGNRPSMGNVNTNGEVALQILRANNVLCASGSDMRLILTEIVDVAGLGGFASWPCSGNKTLEYIAKANPRSFAWRSNAINIYITGAACGGTCAFVSDELILIGQGAQTTTFIHEIGHYLGLYHTHGKYCDGSTNCSSCVGDDDGLSDTLDDAPCWSRETIAILNYGKLYANLTSAQKARVDQTFNNIMSYHNVRTVFTAQQVSRMRYYALVWRGHVTKLNDNSPCFSLFDVEDGEPAPEEIAEEVPYERVEVPEDIAAFLNPRPGDEHAGAPFLPGDVDESLSVDLTDSIRVLSFLFVDGEPLLCDDAADFNDNSEIELGDAVGILSSVLLGQAPPRSLPLGFPTFDRTPDELGCAARIARNDDELP